MHLAQHHFQAQSRYMEGAIHFALSSLFPDTYGFLSLDLDENALWDGRISLLGARGVMPDGLAFHLGEGDPLPAERDVSGLLGRGSAAHLIHLAIPGWRSRDPNCRLDPSENGAARRYHAEEIRLFDETTGSDERPVLVGRKNFMLLPEEEVPEEAVSLPVARVRSDASGHFTFDPDFIPPSLRISASPRLSFMLERLVDRMETKAESLRRRQPGRGASPSEMASHELMSYWLTHAVYTGLGPLKHQVESGDAHPRRVFQELARLAGALCTFSMDADPAELPGYDHDRPETTFDALDRTIRELLEVVLPERCIVVPLTLTDGPALKATHGDQVKPEVMQLLARYDTNLHTGTVDDERAFGESEWVLAVRARVPAETVLRVVPQNVKISSAVDVMRFVAEQNPALPLEHLPSPPSELSPRVGSHYFRVRLQGPAWKLIRVRRNVGVYVPDALPDADLELLVIP